MKPLRQVNWLERKRLILDLDQMFHGLIKKWRIQSMCLGYLVLLHKVKISSQARISVKLAVFCS